MHGIGIGLRVHRDGADAHFPAGPVDAKGDLAAIGDQDLVEHGLCGRLGCWGQDRTKSGSPYSTG